MNQLLKTITDTPVDITYLGIGSSPFSNPLEPKHDQLIPPCFHQMLHHENKTFRFIHFDPCFDQKKEFLQNYFADWNLIPEGDYHWIGEKMDVFIFPVGIGHTKDFDFLKKLVVAILNTKGKLLIQEYTGDDLEELNQRLYEACDEKEKYKRCILVDMTFGTEIGCSTDMTVHQPFYHYDGSFINLHFMKEQDMKRWLGISEKLDTIIKKKCLSSFYHILNQYHVDYRRRCKGEKGLYKSLDYDDSSTPDEIMSVLQSKLLQLFDILVACRVIVHSYQELFTNYKNYDPYKWYDKVYNLVKDQQTKTLTNTVQ